MDRFDLETKIMQISSFADRLNDLARSVIENEINADDIANALIGIAVSINAYENNLFDTFTQVFSIDAYNNNQTFVSNTYT